MLTTILILAAGFTQQAWYTFAPEGKNFRVGLPKQPDSTASRAGSNPGGPSQLTTAELKTPDATYAIQHTESAVKVDPQTLDDGIQRFATARKATLGTITAIVVAGNPGREFELTERSDQGETRSKMRWIVAGKSLFLLTVAANPGARLPGDADRFLTSLEIGSPPPKLAAAPPPTPAPAASPPATAASAPSPAKAEEPESVEVMIGEDDAAGKDDAKTASKTTATPASPKSSAPLRFTISRIPRNAKAYPPEDLVDLSRSYLDKDRDGFRDVGPAGSFLAGMRVSFVQRFGGPKVASAQPVYRSGKTHYLGGIYGPVLSPVTTVVAKPGYAVGGLVTHTGLTVDGFRMVFMKVDGDRLDPNDSYNSPWIGDTKGGSPGEVSSTGGLVVGVQGRVRKELSALGLTALK